MPWVPFAQINYEELVALHGEIYPRPFRVDERLLWSKTVASPRYDPTNSWRMKSGGDTLGAIACKQPGTWQEAAAHVLPITGLWAHETDIAHQLLEKVEEEAIRQGFAILQFGGDADHLWPSLPAESELVADFLTSAGFTCTHESYDVERDLKDYAPPAGAIESLQGCTVRRATPADGEMLAEFFGRAFPSRWRQDGLRRWSSAPQDLVILIAEDRVEGFAITQRDGTDAPIAGANWHIDLGPDWGALGPIGLSEATRGRGWGHGLLAWALQDLQQQGARRTIIDWTVLLDFYGRHGFERARTYQHFSKSLPVLSSR